MDSEVAVPRVEASSMCYAPKKKNHPQTNRQSTIQDTHASANDRMTRAVAWELRCSIGFCGVRKKTHGDNERRMIPLAH